MCHMFRTDELTMIAAIFYQHWRVRVRNCLICLSMEDEDWTKYFFHFFKIWKSFFDNWTKQITESMGNKLCDMNKLLIWLTEMEKSELIELACTDWLNGMLVFWFKLDTYPVPIDLPQKINLFKGIFLCCVK